jgi:hypothetical protein
METKRTKRLLSGLHELFETCGVDRAQYEEKPMIREMKQIVRKLQEESLKILATEAPAQNMKDKGKTEKKQLSLRSFKTEGKVRGNSHVND